MKKKLLSISFVLSSAFCFSQNENLTGNHQLMTTNTKVQEKGRIHVRDLNAYQVEIFVSFKEEKVSSEDLKKLADSYKKIVGVISAKIKNKTIIVICTKENFKSTGIYEGLAKEHGFFRNLSLKK